MRAQRPREARRGVAALPRLALEDRLAQVERARRVAHRPGLGQLVDRHVGVRRDERLDLALADRLAAAQVASLSTSDFERSGIVADELEERRHRIGLGARLALANCAATHSWSFFFATANSRMLPAFAHAFQSAVLVFTSSPTSASTVSGAGLARYAADRVDVGRLPAALAPSLGLPRPVDVLDDDEPRVAEQAPRVAERDGASPDVSSALDSSIASGAKCPRRRASAVSIFGRSLPRDQVDGLLGSVGHARTLPSGPHRELVPSDSTTTRPSSSVR